MYHMPTSAGLIAWLGALSSIRVTCMLAGSTNTRPIPPPSEQRGISLGALASSLFVVQDVAPHRRPIAYHPPLPFPKPLFIWYFTRTAQSLSGYARPVRRT